MPIIIKKNKKENNSAIVLIFLSQINPIKIAATTVALPKASTMAVIKSKGLGISINEAPTVTIVNTTNAVAAPSKYFKLIM